MIRFTNNELRTIICYTTHSFDSLRCFIIEGTLNILSSFNWEFNLKSSLFCDKQNLIKITAKFETLLVAKVPSSLLVKTSISIVPELVESKADSGL
jgi:hypothetical protein